MIWRRFRPLDGWRRFLGEVGIIVLGVMVALGLGAVATSISQRNDVDDARQALSIELGATVGQARNRVVLTPCIERRLDLLAALVNESEKSGRLPPLGRFSSPAWFTWDRGAWDSAVASQTAFRFPRDEVSALGSFYRFVDLLNDSNRRELDVWTRLYAMVGPGRALAPGEAGQLRLAIGEARMLDRLITLAGMRADQIAAAYALPLDRPSIDTYLVAEPAKAAICQPPSPDVPARYGEAAWSDVVERVRQNPITRPAAAR